MTDGGDGTSGKFEEVRKKISEEKLGDKNHRWGLKGELNPQYKAPRPK